MKQLLREGLIRLFNSKALSGRIPHFIGELGTDAEMAVLRWIRKLPARPTVLHRRGGCVGTYTDPDKVTCVRCLQELVQLRERELKRAEEERYEAQQALEELRQAGTLWTNNAPGPNDLPAGARLVANGAPSREWPVSKGCPLCEAHGGFTGMCGCHT
jgi:hypothetical protein